MRAEGIVQGIIKKFGIDSVWHFTDGANFASIQKHGGLLSYAELVRRGVVIPAAGGNDWSHEADAWAGVDEYVHLAFISNHPMLYLAKRDGRITQPYWLKIDGRYYPHVEPSRRSVQRIKERTTALTDRRRTPVPMPILIGELNRTVRGWSNYFHHRNGTWVMSKVKMHVEERVRTHLRRRHHLAGRSQGYHRFPGELIYRDYGLFKLPTHAPWRSAHA